MKTRPLLCLLLLLFVVTNLIAQGDKNSGKVKSSEDKSYFLADVSYINDAVFLGRRDSIAAPYIFPSIGYYDKSGFFADASISYLTGSEENRIDLSLITAGYLFDTKNWSGGISGTAYFYDKDSYNVQSEVVADITGILSYDLKALEVSLSASTYFNNGGSPDIFGGLMLDRTFYAFDTNLLIDPRVSFYMGSQYFYQEYYSTSRLGNRKGQGKGSGSSETITITSVEVAEASEFNFLNVELSLPVQYYNKHFIFSFTPVWAFPQSQATITTVDAVIEEDLENVFYWSVGISYWFYTKKEM
ncbi:hypothetical protein [Arenibacter sp. F20364]|jgi:hypothetical protein|uniref:hypothetical protein n=1 Tax=Arenibacter sp. F20364 TaxID=2926415 RepID=UPI001FF3D479|nr:hypothetical protein [Arenibacter sp. F20364]MCK0192017.1 hypothetical protein [Arenibacter sp. F20364]|tara:strand:- start:655 stop:1557 length:903 start_codon:yes stop_codon:yes gene_type:complete